MVVLALSGLLSSCSWIFVNGPPASAPPPPYAIDCTDSNAAPVIDTTLAALFGLSTLVALAVTADDGSSEDETQNFAIIGATYGATTLAFSLSALGGFRKTSACREMRSARWRSYPPTYYPPPAGYPPATYPPPTTYPQPMQTQPGPPAPAAPAAE